MTEYIPQKQDIVYIDFDPASGREINKRRPAVVVSSHLYSKTTGFVAVCPITHGADVLKKRGLLVAVTAKKADGYVNPLQLHTFDFRSRNIRKIDFLETSAFQKVVNLNTFIFED